MTTIINGSSPSITFSDSTTQTTAFNGQALSASPYTTSLGASTLVNNTGTSNTAIGNGALAANTTASNNTAVGYQALYSYNRTADTNAYVTALGWKAGYSATTGQYSVYVGAQAGTNTTTGELNVFVGLNSGLSNTTGSYNVVLGTQALNTNTTGTNNTALGHTALFNATGSYNTAVGNGAGGSITSGTKNTILGGYNGNSGGLDIRTLSNYIVLSDGDGNPRGYFNNNGSYIVGSTSEDVIGTGANGFSYRPSIGNLSVLAASASALGVGRATTTGAMVYFYYNAVAKGSISTDGSNVAYNTSSDYRLKENIIDLPNALTIISQLKPRQFDWKETKETTTGFIAHELSEVMPQAVTGKKDAVDAEGNPEYQGIDTSFLVATLTAAIQELKAEFDAYKATHP